jgi:hypothetical protein
MRLLNEPEKTEITHLEFAVQPIKTHIRSARQNKTPQSRR